MNSPEGQPEQPVAGIRLKIGVGLFAMSIVLPLAGLPLVATMGLSAGATASISGVILVGSEVLGVSAIAVMGKPGYAFVKNRVFGFLKQYGPLRDVGRKRYRIGLVMLCGTLLWGWSAPYFGTAFPALEQYALPMAILGDLILLASLFVLGGGFWDKLRSLFLHDAQAHFAPSDQNADSEQ